MTLTTSYFAVAKHLSGTKISIARFNHPRIASGVDEVQVSFAPSRELLQAYKQEEIDWNQYKGRYRREQQGHYKEQIDDFTDLLERATVDDIVLLCYERFEGRTTKCHRLLLYRMLQKVAEHEGYGVEFVDETNYVRD
jgi:uncharacterized protein YeaO (DUF488 family)